MKLFMLGFMGSLSCVVVVLGIIATIFAELAFLGIIERGRYLSWVGIGSTILGAFMFGVTLQTFL